jgi:hypothetical protein
MKHILPSLLLIFLSFCGFESKSQINFSPKVGEVNGYSDNFDVAIYSKFTNLSDYDSFRWVRKSNVLATGWESAVCDNIQCHAATVDSSDFLLSKNDSFSFSFHFYPYDKAGQGNMEVYVYALLNPSVNTSGTYKTTIWKLSVPETVVACTFFPNPIQNTLYSDVLKRGAVVSIMNASGAQVARFTFDEITQGADLSFLANGLYIAEINDAGTFSREKLIIRR